MFEFITDWLPDMDFGVSTWLVLIFIVLAEVGAWMVFAYWKSRGIVSLTKPSSQIITYVALPFICYFILRYQAGKE